MKGGALFSFALCFRWELIVVDGKVFFCYPECGRLNGSDDMSAYTGYLIRCERLAQNLSQEGLAKGICAVSYLSKIEQGQVEPGQEIIDRLFAALHIDFVREPELEREAERQLAEFFFLREADEPCDEQHEFFAQHGEKLLCSERNN